MQAHHQRRAFGAIPLRLVTALAAFLSLARFSLSDGVSCFVKGGWAPRSAARRDEGRVRMRGEKKVKFDYTKRAEGVNPFKKTSFDSPAFREGQWVSGTVDRVYKQTMAFVDVGAVEHATLDIGEWTDGFVMPEERLYPGDCVACRVLSNDGNTMKLTLRSGSLERDRPAQNARGDVADFADVSEEVWLDGKVTGITAWGVIIDVAPPNGGKLHAGKVHYKNFNPSFQHDCHYGVPVKVRVAGVNKFKNSLELTMKEVGAEVL
eukprot:TRINITY_DN25322_c0_g1_i1.p1 TRINITY_DN25322_c0_g1~~TRINITY_DN25322_c0_g1_i1.p1  ORF type:complete len:284 (-),score=33.68 TRINITY_DN25322_c0_g1_i1:203-991(-)